MNRLKIGSDINPTSLNAACSLTSCGSASGTNRNTEIKTEQIVSEYKSRVKSCHPDKVPNNPVAAAEFIKLKTVKDVLCDETSRRQYDRWRRSGINISFEDWLNRSAHMSMHWAGSKKKDPMIEASSSQQPEQRTVRKSGNDEELSWQDLRRQFRNYEI